MHPEERERRLSDALDELGRAGETPDVTHLRQLYPDLADDLLPLLKTRGYSGPGADGGPADTPSGPGAPGDPAGAPGPAQFVGGRYKVLEKIGAGSFGKVYKGLDTKLGRYVALKVLDQQEEEADEKECRKRFEREAKAVARVSHINVCAILDFDDQGDDRPYAVLPLYDRTLRSELVRRANHRGRCRDVRGSVELAAQIADGLAAAHEEGVIHRDLKPANIMLDKAGRPVIVDFGLARMEDDPSHLTRTGEYKGTPLYTSPEQALRIRGPGGPAITARSDIYSLGVILYELLTGATPHPGSRSAYALLQAIASPDHPRHPNGFPKDLDPGLRGIVERAMAYDARHRYDARELAEGLRAWLRKSAAGPSGRPARFSRAAGLAALAALACLGFVLGRATVPSPAGAPAGPQIEESSLLKAPPIAPPVAPAAPPSFIAEKDVFRAIREHLLGLPPEARKRQRYFSLANLAKGEGIDPAQLRLCREALGGLLGRLSAGGRGPALRVLPPPADYLCCIDLGRLGWAGDEQWHALKKRYPYGLNYERSADADLSSLAKEVYELAGEDVLCLRADWFLANAGELLPALQASARRGGAGRAPVSREEVQSALGPVRPTLEFYAKDLDLRTAALELGYGGPDALLQEMQKHASLADHAARLAEGRGVSRRQWSSLEHESPLFQEVALELNLGTPRGQ
jgi:hypothetical protein